MKKWKYKLICCRTIILVDNKKSNIIEKINYFNIEIKSTNFELYDTWGVNKYRKLSKAIILVYDPMDEKYFKEMRNNWYKDLKNFWIFMDVVFNKTDLNEKIIKEEKGKAFAENAWIIFGSKFLKRLEKSSKKKDILLFNIYLFQVKLIKYN